MAEDNVAVDVEVGQGELRNLHIEGTPSQVHQVCSTYLQLNSSILRSFSDDDRFADAEEE